jgi:hypothetical protein
MGFIFILAPHFFLGVQRWDGFNPQITFGLHPTGGSFAYHTWASITSWLTCSLFLGFHTQEGSHARKFTMGFIATLAQPHFRLWASSLFWLTRTFFTGFSETLASSSHYFSGLHSSCGSRNRLLGSSRGMAQTRTMLMGFRNDLAFKPANFSWASCA